MITAQLCPHYTQKPCYTTRVLRGTHPTRFNMSHFRTIIIHRRSQCPCCSTKVKQCEPKSHLHKLWGMYRPATLHFEREGLNITVQVTVSVIIKNDYEYDFICFRVVNIYTFRGNKKLVQAQARNLLDSGQSIFRNLFVYLQICFTQRIYMHPL